MATIPATRVRTAADGRTCIIWKWGPFGAGDTCTPVVCAQHKDKTVHLAKGSGFGGTVTIKGSVNPASDATLLGLHNTDLSAMTATADFIGTVQEHVYQIAPSPGASVAGVTCYLILGDSK